MLRRILRKHDDGIVEGTRLIVGLGNPGSEHSKNRHNVGFQVLERLASQYRLSFDRLEFKGLLARGEIEGEPVILLKPLSYMNQSGGVVKPVMSRYKIRLGDLLLIYDDLDLTLGKTRIRASGGSAGHRGMKSIISSLGTDGMARLRIGIGRPSGGPPEEYVLQDFSLEESIIMETAYEKAVACVLFFIREGIDVCMNEYN
ncbi:MAG TPA: aminoacyl-tRNA hydrolase [Anaerolineae bacterium]|nr:aminoacyl-tRNA hydrolase [Anaerolineae bacterium]